VVELHEVLTQTMSDPAAKSWPLDRQDRAQRSGSRPRRGHPRLPGLAALATTCRVVDRWHVHPRSTEGTAVGLPCMGARKQRCHRVFDAAAAEYSVHPRHHLLDLFRGDAEPVVLACAPRRDDADEGDLSVSPRVRRLPGVVGRPRKGLGDGQHRGRRCAGARKRCRDHRHE
jgi:hypothetical protein